MRTLANIRDGLLIGALVMGSFLGLKVGAEYLAEWKCDKRAESVDSPEGDWEWFVGCRVLTENGRWINYENYVVNNPDDGG